MEETFGRCSADGRWTARPRRPLDGKVGGGRPTGDQYSRVGWLSLAGG